MAILRRVVVISAAPLFDETIEGGAQRMLASTVRALNTLSTQCLVLSSACWQTSLRLDLPFDRAFDAADLLIRAEYLAQHTPRCAFISKETAVELIRSADLIAVADRSVGRLPADRLSVLALSNLAYDCEKIAAESGGWDAIWVPSDYLRRQVIHAYAFDPRTVYTIPPALDEAYLEIEESEDERAAAWLASQAGLQPQDTERWRVVAFPHRPDPQKGLLDVLGLLQRLVRRDPWWKLIITDPGPRETGSDAAFFREALREHARTGLIDNVVRIPWQRPRDMRQLYSVAECTVMASSLPEGFGLVPLESIACGTPAVVKETGALSDHRGRLPGLHLVADVDSEECADLVVEVAGRRVGRHDRQRLIETYSFEHHADRVIEAVMRLWSGRP